MHDPDGLRAALENLEPAQYLSSSYFERWLTGLETQVDSLKASQEANADAREIQLEKSGRLIPEDVCLRYSKKASGREREVYVSGAHCVGAHGLEVVIDRDDFDDQDTQDNLMGVESIKSTLGNRRTRIDGAPQNIRAWSKSANPWQEILDEANDFEPAD